MAQVEGHACLQVKAGDLLHEGHHSKKDMTVAVIYHGYTDA